MLKTEISKKILKLNQVYFKSPSPYTGGGGYPVGFCVVSEQPVLVYPPGKRPAGTLFYNGSVLTQEPAGEPPKTELLYSAVGTGVATCRGHVNDTFWAKCKNNLLKDITRKAYPKHVTLLVKAYSKEVYANLVRPETGVVSAIRHYEELFNFKGRTFVSPTDVVDTVIFNMPVEWLPLTPLISFYTLLIRIGSRYDGKTPFTEWFEATTHDGKFQFQNADKSAVQAAIVKVPLFVEHGIHPEEMIRLKLENVKLRIGGYNGPLDIGSHEWGINNVEEELIKKAAAKAKEKETK